MGGSTIRTARYDPWMADGSPNFGIIQPVHGITTVDAAIYLQRGAEKFGACHIETKHAQWVKNQGCCAPELVWRKCRHSGTIWSTEEAGKCKIWLPLTPAGLLVLRYVESKNFWTVVSLYFHQGPLDGQRIRAYSDSMRSSKGTPTFTIAALPSQPNVTVKSRRVPLLDGRTK